MPYNPCGKSILVPNPRWCHKFYKCIFLTCCCSSFHLPILIIGYNRSKTTEIILRYSYICNFPGPGEQGRCNTFCWYTGTSAIPHAHDLRLCMGAPIVPAALVTAFLFFQLICIESFWLCVTRNETDSILCPGDSHSFRIRVRLHVLITSYFPASECHILIPLLTFVWPGHGVL